VRAFIPALAAFLSACAGQRGAAVPEQAPALTPLGSFAAVRMIVLPVQQLRSGDALGWSARAGEPRRFLATVDTALSAEFRDRGMGTMWAFPGDLARTARRNPTHATDPAMIRAGSAVRAMEQRRGTEIPEPVASQLRVLAGFHDTRHALVPVEMRFEAAAGGGSGGHAVLRVAILDVRASTLVWTGEIAGKDSDDYTAELAIDLARRFADLIVSR
jgi:hypothetical protein